MPITALSLSNFRNHRDSRLDGCAKFNVLFGDNGAGKTNVLEAISLLSPGRGMRRAPLSEIGHDGGNGDFALSCRLGDISIGTGVTLDQPGRRQVRINGTPHAANRLAEWMSVIWLTPAMDRLFNESAGERRRFLDRLVLGIDPSHARNSTRYEAAMRERNRLLSEHGRPAPEWLGALEGRMAEYGAALDAARHRLVAQLNSRLESTETGIFAKPELALGAGSPREVSTMVADWAVSRARDRAAGRTLVGPHRDDLVVTLRQKQQEASRSSTGEQKAMLIAIILAHADLVDEASTRPPVLLLDEVAAHLDAARRASLYEQLAARNAQYWMTGTDRDLFGGIGQDCSFYEVQGGTIAAIG